MSSSMFYRVRLITAVLSSILISSVCSALGMDVSAGFDNVVVGNRWTPIAVTLSNTSHDTIEGELYVASMQNDVARRPATCRAAVLLPPNSKKLFHIYARMLDYTENKVVLERNGREIISKPLKPSMLSNEALVVSVGEPTSRLNFLSGMMITAPSGQPRPISVGSISVPLLPDRPAAYEGVSLLVLSDQTITSTDTKKLQAISMWVASGGVVVIPTGPNIKLFDNEFYKDLLPVRITGTADLSTLSTLASMGGKPLPSGKITVAKSEPKPGVCTRVVSESGIPIYAERDYGSGKVIFLAFDHLSAPVRYWEGQGAFWSGIVKGSRTRPLVQTLGGFNEQDARMRGYPVNNNNQDSLLKTMEETIVLQPPSMLTITIFLLAYLIVLVPLNYFVLHWRRKRELAWITIPAIVFVFSIGAYGIGYKTNGHALALKEATVIEGSSNSRYAREVTEAMLYSPASRSYRLTTSDPYALVQPLSNAVGTVYTAEETNIESFKVAMWSSEAMESTSGTDLGGYIEPNLTYDGTTLRGTIHNGTTLDMKTCYLILDGRVGTIGGLKPGQTRSFNNSLSEFLNSGRTGMDERARYVAGLCGQSGKLMLFSADAKKPAYFDMLDRRPETSAVTCCAFAMGYTFKTVPGQTFSIDPSQISGRVESYEITNPNGTTSGGPQGVPPAQQSMSHQVSINLSQSNTAVLLFHIQTPSSVQVDSLNLGVPTLPLKAFVRNWTTDSWDAVDMNKPITAAKHITKDGKVGLRFINTAQPCTFSVVLSATGHGR